MLYKFEDDLFLGFYLQCQYVLVKRVFWKGNPLFDTDICCVRPSNSNLIFCEEAFFEEEYLVLLYEYCGKTTLKQLLNEKQNLSEETVINIIFQILLGLEFLHLKNISHGNLNLSTVHIDEIGVIKISMLLLLLILIILILIRRLWIYFIFFEII
jgi:serine/threonine protein kinase